MINWYFLLIAVLFSILLGILLGIIIRKIQHEKGLNKANQTYKEIVDSGIKEVENYKKETILETKEEVSKLKKQAEQDINERKKIVIELETKLSNRENQIEKRLNNIDKREDILSSKELKIEEKEAILTDLNSKAEEKLVEIEKQLEQTAQLTKEQAKDIIMSKTKQDLQIELSKYIKEEEEKAHLKAQSNAKSILALAMQKYAADATAENTISIINLPNEEMKGRIVGKEGRNIKAFEALTGTDILIDDTPNIVTVSGFDPVRREIAKRSLEALINDGRIHPARIEEVVPKYQKEVDDLIYQKGEEAVYALGLGNMNLDLIKLVGKLNFRTSYGQNVLKHSMEVAFLTGKLAAEIGENEYIARRAGLLHDIGKAIDHEVEGSHVEIGVKFAQRYNEPIEVLDAIASHHNDTEAKTIIAVLVAAADALSAARPGARNESHENYVKRLQQLEEIAKEDTRVKKAYAIQAGREVRVIVKPELVDDSGIISIARNIKEKIEKEMSYPGIVKVTVIREKRAVETAK